MELPTIEHDPDFGSVTSEAALASGIWAEAAERNVGDKMSVRQDKISELRALLADRKIRLHPGDDHQLLGILRASNCEVKWAGEVAQAFLEYQKYCTMASPSKVKEMIAANLKYGRRVIVYKMWDGDRFPYKDIMNMFYVISLTLAREPKTQATGITMVGDMSGMSRKHVPSTWSDVTAYATYMKGGAPVWFHKIHLINAPRLFEILYSFAQPFLNDKTRGNIVMHKKGPNGLRTLHAEVDPSILPAEFGGNAPADLDNGRMLEEVMKLEEYFLDLQKSSQG